MLLDRIIEAFAAVSYPRRIQQFFHIDQLLKNLQVSGLRIVASCEQVTTLRKGEFISIIDVSDVKAPFPGHGG
jgi:hypothetical protein